MTIKDIAEHFGISISMVSRAINNSGYIREDLRKEIIEYARLHHWQPSKRAVSLKTGSSHTVGVVVPYINTNQFEFIPMLIARLSYLKYSWQFVLGGTPEQIDALTAYPVEMILSINITDAQMGAFQNAISKNIPVLNIFGRRDNIPSIISPHKKAVYNCIKTLVEQGHRKIAYVGLDFRINTSDLSTLHFSSALEGMQEAIRDFELDFDIGKDCVFSDGYDFDNSAIKKLLQKNEYTAVFGWTVFAEIAFYTACRELGVAIGKDISFIGFEGNNTLKGFNPPPMYYEFDYNAMLDAVTRFVQNKGKNFPIFTETGFTLMQGESICKI